MMQLEGKLRPFAGSGPSRPPVNRDLRRLAHWVQRRFYRYQPGAILAIFAVLVGVPLALDLFVPPVRNWLDGQAQRHEVGVSLLEHVVVAALVAAAAFYWVLGLKRQQALTKYRARAREKPWELVEWSRGEALGMRGAMSQNLADGIARSLEPAVAVVQGRAGTGRTAFVVGLVRALAERNLIPIPVLAGRDGSFALEDVARRVFCQHIDEVVSSDQQSDAIWHRAKATRDLVILVDGLDDEVVTVLSRDGGSRFRKAVESLQDQAVPVVFATTRDLPLGDITPLREDLDLFSRDEAYSYVRTALDGKAPANEAVAALERLHDPVDDVLVARDYLEFIVRLQEAGILLRNLPERTDAWRATVLAAYLDGIDRGKIVPSDNLTDPDAPAPRQRGQAAKRVAEALAFELTTERADLTVARTSLSVDDRALDDADDLNLLWHGSERVGFAGDDLGAYLVAATSADPAPLLADFGQVAEREWSGKRRDRHVLLALIFWHLRQGGEERTATFEQLLTEAASQHWTQPAVVAALVRILTNCGLDDFSNRVADCVRSCIDSLAAERETARPRNASELLRLVRALAEWRAPEAHRLLWQLATNRDTEVEWPAAKALALAAGGPGHNLEPDIEEALRDAEKHPTPAVLSDPDSALGNKIESLAWILPALRGEDRTEDQLARVEGLCLAESMSPLRGEMSLAQGLKLAIVNDRMAVENAEVVRDLLFTPGVRFWHARLVLAQALLAYTWKHREAIDEVKSDLDALRSREPHPLVKHGIELAHEGLRELNRSSDSPPYLGSYMWLHEREAVKWVEQGKDGVAQLAGDVVLLSNMTYRLWMHDPQKADRVAAGQNLPLCIRKCTDRKNIMHGRDCCPDGLCRLQKPPAVLATRARFSDNFCREQARLVAQHGPPPWTRRGFVIYPPARRQRLEEFWDDQAGFAQRGR